MGWGSLLALLLLTSCTAPFTSIRPIVKIGLIAPFEGLYRESGYAALEAMRQAIAECAPPEMDILPLALDDSGDPAQAQRASQKLLVDPAMVAVVGPLLLETIPAVAEVITSTADVAWYIPPLAAPEGTFYLAAREGWLAAQVDFIASNSQATRVLLLGLPAAWQLQVEASVPTLRVDDPTDAPATIAAGDAILWLGEPHEGARWLSERAPEEMLNDFWLAPQAGIDLFAAHYAPVDDADQRAIHWLLWTDSAYNHWLHQPAAQQGTPTGEASMALRYAVYRATCTAIHDLAGGPAAPGGWQVQSRSIEDLHSD